MTFEKNSCSLQLILRKLTWVFSQFCEIIAGYLQTHLEGEKLMKRNVLVPLFVRAVIVSAVLFSPLDSFAGVNVNVGINIPLPVFEITAPPAMVVVPGTYVYYAPNVSADIVFYHNYWYRPYGECWYRATSYNGPWSFVAVNSVPAPVLHLPPDYRRVPPGQERIPYGQLKKNWKGWERDRYWDRHEIHHEAKEFRRAEKERLKEERKEAKREQKGHERY
jgi:hypothetical protein